MKANWTIWNRIVAALSSVVLLWVLAPRHDCFCGTLHTAQASSTSSSDAPVTHECCKVKKQAEQVSKKEHDCCGEKASASSEESSKTSTQADAQQKECHKGSSENVIQDVSCYCSPERAIFGEARKLKPTSDGDGNGVFAPVSSNQYEVVSLLTDERVALRHAELQNDRLKPSKIFLLNRALLN